MLGCVIRIPSIITRLISLLVLFVFLILKWTNVIDWSWGIVLIPLYVWGGIFILTFAICLIEAFLPDKTTKEIEHVIESNELQG